MNCKSARQLLEFARPQDFDLDAADRAALDQHLADCPECDRLLRGLRQFDGQLGQAIRDVPVPKGLSDRIKGRLRQERDEYWRQWMGRGARYAAAAAAVFLLVFAGFSFWKEHRPRIDAETAIQNVERIALHPSEPNEVQDYFKSKGEPGVIPPRDFNYAYLRSFSLTDNLPELQGKRVPHLIFIRPATASNAAATAEVYILRAERFKFDEDAAGDRSGDQFKVRVESPMKNLLYVIVYTGNLNDLKTPAPQTQ